MISYLIDGVLLVAVIAASVGIALIYRQLRLLRLYHQQYERVFAETGYAVGAIDAAIRDINAHGAQILLSLGQRIDEAYKLMDDIDASMNALVDQYDARREATNVVQFSTLLGGSVSRYADPRQERPAADHEEPAARSSRSYQEPAPQPRVEKPVQWPTLGDRFSQWRGSEEQGREATSTAGRRQ